MLQIVTRYRVDRLNEVVGADRAAGELHLLDEAVGLDHVRGEFDHQEERDAGLWREPVLIELGHDAFALFRRPAEGDHQLQVV